MTEEEYHDYCTPTAFETGMKIGGAVLAVVVVSKLLPFIILGAAGLGVMVALGSKD